jgi:hypothetical protein
MQTIEEVLKDPKVFRWHDLFPGTGIFTSLGRIHNYQAKTQMLREGAAAIQQPYKVTPDEIINRRNKAALAGTGNAVWQVGIISYLGIIRGWYAAAGELVDKLF